MTQTIVIVEDVPEVRTMVRIAVEYEPGLEVVGEADNGARGIEAAQRLQPRVVVLDLGLPDVPGREAFSDIRRVAPGARIVVYAGEESDRRWYESRGAVFVAKANPIDELLAAVRPLSSGVSN